MPRPLRDRQHCARVNPPRVKKNVQEPSPRRAALIENARAADAPMRGAMVATRAGMRTAAVRATLRADRARVERVSWRRDRMADMARVDIRKEKAEE